MIKNVMISHGQVIIQLECINTLIQLYKLSGCVMRLLEIPNSHLRWYCLICCSWGRVAHTVFLPNWLNIWRRSNESINNSSLAYFSQHKDCWENTFAKWTTVWCDCGLHIQHIMIQTCYEVLWSNKNKTPPAERALCIYMLCPYTMCVNLFIVENKIKGWQQGSKSSSHLCSNGFPMGVMYDPC